MTPVDPRDVETPEYRRSSLFSRVLRAALHPIVLALSAEADRPAFAPQLAEASRNVEIAAEWLLRLLARHPVKTASVIAALRDWLSSYYGAQRAARERPRVLVYTQLDDRIPFVPDEDTMYAYMIAQIAYVATELCEIVPVGGMREIADGFIDANRLGVAVFHAHPTVMPRFLGHDRLSLRVIQRVDEPVNCCPSLHIAYSILLDNIAAKVIAPRPERREVFDSIRYSTKRMFNSVLYTKQHSLVDVAFGILCAKLVYERRFRARLGREFDDFLSVFTELAPQHPTVAYDAIAAMYGEALTIQERTGDLTATVGEYLRRRGFVALAPGEDASGICFDLDACRLVPSSRAGIRSARSD